MLKFDHKGLLKPNGPIPSTLEDLKSIFVDGIDSGTRKSNFDKYIRYSDELKTLLGGIAIKQWVNGSFVTRIKDPEDIDLISFIDTSSIKSLGSKLKPFIAEQNWTIYGVDAYIIEVHPIGSRNAKYYTEHDIAYWLDRFGHTRPNRRGLKSEKGFLEIIY